MIAISQGKQADVGVLDTMILEPGAFCVMDRGYVDFARLYRFVLAGACFVSRAKVRIPTNSDTDSETSGQQSGIFGQLSERSDALA